MAQKAESLFFVSEFAQRKFDAVAARSEDRKRPKARVIAEYLFEIAFAADVVAALVRPEAKDGRAEGLQRRAVHSH